MRRRPLQRAMGRFKLDEILARLAAIEATLGAGDSDSGTAGSP